MTLPRKLQSQLEKLGLEPLSVRTSTHICLRLRNRHGVVGTIVVSKSPSDHRSSLNQRSHLRRLARQRKEDP